MSTSSRPALHTPTSNRGGENTPSQKASASTQTSAAIALSMSWQLLVTLVLPLVGGHYLDVRYGATPLWTIVGGLVAIVGCIVVVRQAMQQLAEVMRKDEER